MGNAEADRQKAMAAVRAMFERYKKLAELRPKDHVVRYPISIHLPCINVATQDFDRQVMESLELVDAGLDGSVAYEMTIVPNLSNLNSMLHPLLLGTRT